VLTKESKERLFACLTTLEVELDSSQLHRDPERPDYCSSSYDAELGRHVAPRGGFGAPQDVNASFCHDHTDESFEKLHPDVDLDAYNAPVSSKRRKVRSRAKPRGARAMVPTIVITDTDTAVQALPEESVQAAAQGASLGLKVGIYKTRSALAVNTTAVKATAVKATAVKATAVKATAVKATAVKATAVKATAVKATAVKATAIKATAEKENGMPKQTGAGEDASAAEQLAAATSSHTAEKLDINDGAGIVKKDSQDSAYESQALLNAILFSDDDISDLAADYGSSDINDSDNDDAPVVPRNKLTPRKPIATRRSSRISAHTTDLQPASDSSLGKHKRQVEVDNDAQEPEGKRTKAALP
jgi:hypothetical protein